MNSIPMRSQGLAAAATALLAYILYSNLKGPSTRLISKPEVIARSISDKGSTKGADEDEEPEYDVVIIGGGTAGCVLASRLSENPKISVLLLESGGSAKDVFSTSIPVAWNAIMHSKHDYGLWTKPQENAKGETKYWPRAKLLGGCTAMNAMMFHQGAPEDYDEWARIIGDNSWSYKEFRKYFIKFEKYTPSPKYPDVDVKLRGSEGPVNVGYFGYCSAATTKWIESCINAGIPKSPDFNTPAGTMGVNKVMTYIDKKGRRVSAEAAYLTPDVLNRPNLKVAIFSPVSKIIFDTSKNPVKAVGVEFTSGLKNDGKRYRVRVKKEVILAAGAIHSPHILLLSGVGPKEDLHKHGIPVVHDLPGVGHNLYDHSTVTTRLSLKPGLSLQYLTAKSGLNLLSTQVELAKWYLTGKGPMGSNAGESAAFVRTDDPKLFSPDKYHVKDLASGPGAPDLELIMVPVGMTAHGFGDIPPGESITLIAVLLRPQSKGTITLKSANPLDAPVVDPHYLESSNDLAVLVRGLKLLVKVANTEPLASEVLRDVSDPLLDHDIGSLSDEDMEEEIRKRVETLYHPTSTCRMAPLEENGVVDSTLKVYGLQNVRVVDASIFPNIIAGHTTAPVIAVAEKASDIIKSSLIPENWVWK
ncbi:GMC oxidoreductase [Sphaerobolus stellatus SS14]|nr:GMC oxidoreductase [Sphaerobolus stellatus SS14]